MTALTLPASCWHFLEIQCSCSNSSTQRKKRPTQFEILPPSQRKWVRRGCAASHHRMCANNREPHYLSFASYPFILGHHPGTLRRYCSYSAPNRFTSPGSSTSPAKQWQLCRSNGLTQQHKEHAGDHGIAYMAIDSLDHELASRIPGCQRAFSNEDKQTDGGVSARPTASCRAW